MGQRQGNWLVAADARLASGVRLDDWGCIGAAAEICSGACLCRTVIWPGARISASTVVADSIVTD
jgi:hypothetical protein